jgi:hypothetical protein
MSEPVKAPLKRAACIYHVFTPLFLAGSGEWIPAGTPDRPVTADLSDLSDAMIHWLLENHGIETADGVPINKATGIRASGVPCPCSK